MIDTHAHLLSFKNVDEIVNSMEDDELEYISTTIIQIQRWKELCSTRAWKYKKYF